MRVTGSILDEIGTAEVRSTNKLIIRIRDVVAKEINKKKIGHLFGPENVKHINYVIKLLRIFMQNFIIV